MTFQSVVEQADADTFRGAARRGARAPGAFRYLDVEDRIHVIVVPSSEPCVTVLASTAEDLSTVITQVLGDTLKVNGGQSAVADARMGSVHVTAGRSSLAYAGDVNILATNGGIAAGGVIRVNGQVVHVTGSGVSVRGTRGDVVVVVGSPLIERAELRGCGTVHLRGVAQDHLAVSLLGSGTVRIDGEVDVLTLGLTGSGDIRAEDCPARNATARLTGSGEIRLTATASADLLVTGSGEIRYRGSPTNVRQLITGSGDIRPTE